MRRYLAEHPEQREKARQRSKAWRARNRDRHRAYSRTYTKTHYVPAVRKTAEERFWAKVQKTDTCWLWTGGISGAGRGYGYFFDGERVVRAHRWSYQQSIGAIPVGLVLDHLCHQTTCVRPEHLEAVTQAENVRRHRSL